MFWLCLTDSILKVANIDINILNICRFNPTHNKGISFGLLKNFSYLWILILLMIIVMFYLTLSTRSNNFNPFKLSIKSKSYTSSNYFNEDEVSIMSIKISNIENIAYTLITAGATANFIHRMYFGYVFDYLEIYYKSTTFFICNISDIYISIGFLILFIINLVYRNQNG